MPFVSVQFTTKTELTLSDSLVLDKTRYQRNAVVQAMAAQLGITLVYRKVGLDRSCRRNAEMPVVLRQGLAVPPPRRTAGQSLPENPNRSTHSWESKRAPNYRRFS